MIPQPYDIEDYYHDVSVFNDIAGNLKDVTYDKLKAQARVLKEECQELVDGLNNDDKEEILDGAVDVVYVAFGVLQMLDKLGYNVVRAMLKTSENNLTKFPRASNTAVESIDDHADNGVTVTATYNPYHECYVLKDTNGKIRKPIGYVKNDLKDCLPKE